MPPSRIPPLHISAFTATSAVGVGKEPLLSALEQSTQRPARQRLRRDAAADLDRPRRRARRDSACRRTWRAGTAATTGWPGSGCRPMASSRRLRRRANATAPARIALVLGTSTSSIGETEEAYTRLDADGGFPAELRRPPRAHAAFARDFVQEALGLDGPAVTISTACSSSAKVVRAGRAADPRWAWPTRPWSAAWTRCAAACCSASTRWSWSRPSPAAPSTPSATASAWARPRASRCWSAARRRLAAAGLRREPATPTTCRRRTPKGWARARASTTRWRAPASRPGDIDYINLHGTASHKNDEVEARAGRRAVSRRHRCQLHQGLDRPHAGRGRHRRGRDHAAGAGDRA